MANGEWRMTNDEWLPQGWQGRDRETNLAIRQLRHHGFTRSTIAAMTPSPIHRFLRASDAPPRPAPDWRFHAWALVLLLTSTIVPFIRYSFLDRAIYLTRASRSMSGLEIFAS